MTAEIAILNKTAVALAADSAVTVSGGPKSKIFNTVNKLFCLSRSAPVGVMVYGAAELAGVPWETIVKVYRGKLGGQDFPTLEEYASHFLKFLNGNALLFPESTQARCVATTLHEAFRLVVEDVEAAYTKAHQAKGSAPSQGEMAVIVEAMCGSARRQLEALAFRAGQSETDGNSLRTRYADVITKVRDGTFVRLPLTAEAQEHLLVISGLVFTKLTSIGPSSGVVVAGFGEAEVFPSVASFEVFGVQNDQLRFVEGSRGGITQENRGQVLAFAQREMAVTFLEGVDPDYADFLASALDKLLQRYPEEVVKQTGATGTQADAIRGVLTKLGEGSQDALHKELANYRQERHISPVLDAVEHLSKEDLAALAESLVNLTSLKRRFTLSAETVGGPIDVAVISKGDGFVWMKRKHYFRSELNPQFFTRFHAGDAYALIAQHAGHTQGEDS